MKKAVLWSTGVIFSVLYLSARRSAACAVIVAVLPILRSSLSSLLLAYVVVKDYRILGKRRLVASNHTKTGIIMVVRHPTLSRSPEEMQPRRSSHRERMSEGSEEENMSASGEWTCRADDEDGKNEDDKEEPVTALSQGVTSVAVKCGVSLSILGGWSPRRYAQLFGRFRIEELAQRDVTSVPAGSSRTTTATSEVGQAEQMALEETSFRHFGRFVAPNRLVPFENDCFKGVMLLMVRTADMASAHARREGARSLTNIDTGADFAESERGEHGHGLRGDRGARKIDVNFGDCDWPAVAEAHLARHPKRLFEVQIQGCFKVEPRGILYVGAELPRRLRLGAVPAATVKICMSLIKARLPDLHWSLGKKERLTACITTKTCAAPRGNGGLSDDSNTSGDLTDLELPHVAFPLYRAMDRIICTEGDSGAGGKGSCIQDEKYKGEPEHHDIAPRLGTEFPEDDAAVRVRRGGQAPDVPFRVGPTYSFSYHNPWTDFSTWTVKGMPTGPLRLTDFIGNLPIAMVVYDVYGDDAGITHQYDQVSREGRHNRGSCGSGGKNSDSSTAHRQNKKNYYLNMLLGFDLDLSGADLLF